MWNQLFKYVSSDDTNKETTNTVSNNGEQDNQLGQMKLMNQQLKNEISLMTEKFKELSRLLVEKNQVIEETEKQLTQVQSLQKQLLKDAMSKMEEEKKELELQISSLLEEKQLADDKISEISQKNDFNKKFLFQKLGINDIGLRNDDWVEKIIEHFNVAKNLNGEMVQDVNHVQREDGELKIIRLEKENFELKQKIDDLNKKLETMPSSTSHVEYEKRIHDCEFQLIKLSEHIRKISEENEKLIRLVTTKEELEHDLNKRLRERDQQIIFIQKERDEIFSEKNKQLEIFSNQNKQIILQNESLFGENKEMSQKLELLTSQMKDKSKQIELLQIENKEKNHQIEIFSHKNQETLQLLQNNYSNKIESLEIQNRDKNQQIQMLVNQLEEKEKQLETLNFQTKQDYMSSYLNSSQNHDVSFDSLPPSHPKPLDEQYDEEIDENDEYNNASINQLSPIKKNPYIN